MGQRAGEDTYVLIAQKRIQNKSMAPKKGKGVCKLFMEIHLTATQCHLPYGITQCYLPPDTSEHTPPLPQPDRLVLDLLTI